MTARFTDLAEGRRLLDAMREEEKNTSPHEPRPAYVDWVVWTRNNAEMMLDSIFDINQAVADLAKERCLDPSPSPLPTEREMGVIEGLSLVQAAIRQIMIGESS